jgi:hypothetical protein
VGAAQPRRRRLSAATLLLLLTLAVGRPLMAYRQSRLRQAADDPRADAETSVRPMA